MIRWMQTGEKHSFVPSQREEAHVKDSRGEFTVLVAMAEDVNDSASVVRDEGLTSRHRLQMRH